MKKIVINTDGGSRGNPGSGACAFVVFDENGKFVVEEGKYLGVCTNNEAEYQAIVLALKWLSNNYLTDLPEMIDFKADSKLVVEQLSGRYKVKNPRLRVLYEQVRELEKSMTNIIYSYIPRAENYRADKLVNQILDQQH